MPVAPDDILLFLNQNARRPLTAKEILGHFQLSRSERQEAVRLLEQLADEGVLVRLKNSRFSLPRRINLVTGTVSVHRDGYGFLAPQDQTAEDVFIPARFLREVMHGDRVVARLERSSRPGGQSEGRVLRVLARAHREVVGRYEAGERFGYVVPSDPRLGADIFIAPSARGAAVSGQIVIARIDVYPGRNRNPEGVIVRVLGDPLDPEVEILSLVHKHGLPYEFPDAVLAAAELIPEGVGEEERQGRVDLRQLPIVTIDGESARDFDDAVSVTREEGGRIRLWVCIADVSHYVAEGGVLDLEARERGTSVYFPDRCIPMLPERLSNGICSLNPQVDRLTLTAEMVFDRQGLMVQQRFYPSLIRSRERLTYTTVRDLLVGDDPDLRLQYAELLPQLQLMAELSRRLTDMRRSRGSLDFDLPEAQVVLDLQGRPENIVRGERNLAHQLIEEFMLAANEAVAAFLEAAEAPLLYRIHEPPELEKMLAFQQFVAYFNYGLSLDGGGVDPRQLQRLLSEAAGKPEERMVNQSLLRCMKQARYAPDNVGHFGLAAEHYCHFTSPIRRYPDLLVHRVLRRALQPGGLKDRDRSQLRQILPGLGELTSARERRAMEAEREIVELKKCQFMADKVGEEFAGIVAGVQSFGFFVELKDYFVEGLVHLSGLGDDFYVFDPELHRLLGQNRRRSFQVGDEVTVALLKVDLERRQIDFGLAREGTSAAPSRRRPATGRSRGKGRRS